MGEDFKQKVENFRDAIKNERWNDISAQVWGNSDNRKALSEAVRSEESDDVPRGEFKKNDKGELVIEFTRPGMSGWVKDHLGQKPEIKL